MKWNELPDEATLILREDLMFLPDEALEPGQLYTRAEVASMLEVAYPAGTVFTFDLEEEVLYDKDGGICTQVPELRLGTEVDARFEVQ